MIYDMTQDDENKVLSLANQNYTSLVLVAKLKFPFKQAVIIHHHTDANRPEDLNA